MTPTAMRAKRVARRHPCRSPSSSPRRCVSEEERRARFEEAYAAGELFAILGIFADQAVNPEANDIVAEMIREKIRSIVNDPETAESLCPKDYSFGTKRPCLDTDYFETYNLPHVRLVDLRKDPITTITETGIDTAGESFEFDAIVYATGFDAMTGAIVSVDITGRDGRLAEAEVGGRSDDLPRPDDGRVPELVRHHRPGEPVGAVEHGGVDRAARRVGRRLLADLQRRAASTRSSPPSRPRRAGCSTSTTAPTSPSTRRRTPGTWAPTCPASRGCSCPTSGASTPTAAMRRGRSRSYLGFELAGPAGAQCNDGVVRRLQPDVADGARDDGRPRAPAPRDDVGGRGEGVHRGVAAERPAGPEVGEIVDGTLPGAGRRPRLPALPAGHAGAPSGRRLLPRGRLGARQ